MRRNVWRAYEIVLKTDADAAPIALESVGDANEATLAFHQQFQRLMRERAIGELVLLNRYGQSGLLDWHPVLRVPLG